MTQAAAFMLVFCIGIEPIASGGLMMQAPAFAITILALHRLPAEFIRRFDRESMPGAEPLAWAELERRISGQLTGAMILPLMPVILVLQELGFGHPAWPRGRERPVALTNGLMAWIVLLIAGSRLT